MIIVQESIANGKYAYVYLILLNYIYCSNVKMQKYKHLYITITNEGGIQMSMRNRIMSLLIVVIILSMQISGIAVSTNVISDEAGTVILRPTDATYVSQHGTDNDTNYYGESVMKVNNTSHNSGSNDWGQYGYMKFDIGGISKERIRSAKLRVYVENDGDKSSSKRTIGIYDTCDKDWNGTTLTWSNNPYPYAKTQLGTFEVNANGSSITDAGWREIDITDYVRDNIEDTLSFMVKMQTWPAYNVVLSSGTYIGEPDNFDSALYNENMPQIVVDYCHEAIVPYSTTMLFPSRDIYVDQHTPSTNYLYDEYMQVNFTDNETRSDRYGRYAYMDFDISNIDKETLSTAKLWVYVDPNSDTRYSTRTIGVFAPTSTWSDSMTWSNGRVAASGEAIGTYTVTGNDFDIIDYGWKCIDVTDYVKNSSSDTISLMMQSINSNAHPVLVRSNEHSDENTRPRLVVTNDLLPVANMEWDSWESILEHKEPDQLYESSIELPPSVDLSSKFPVPHSKGQSGQNNCVPWAVAYALKSGQENIARNWGVDTDEHIFSPSYVYNQLNNGSKDNGVTIDAVMGLIVDQGVCSIKSFPYVASDWTTQPTQQQVAEAAKYKADGYNTVIGVDNIKRHLAGNDGVVIGIYVLDQFDLIHSGMPESDWPSPIFDDPTSPQRINKDGTIASHALCLVGYDDNLEAFKFINSWGNNKGNNGYGWIAYNMLSDTRVNKYGIAVGYVLQKSSGSTAPIYIAATAGDGGTVTGNGIYNYGDTVTLTATPDEGYVFDGWYENDTKIVDADETYSFIAEDVRIIEARFQ